MVYPLFWKTHIAVRLWNLPPMQYYLQHPRIHFVRSDVCQWGTRWKKPTGFLIGNLDHNDTARLAQAICTNCPRGLCSRTGKPHFFAVRQQFSRGPLHAYSASIPHTFESAVGVYTYVSLSYNIHLWLTFQMIWALEMIWAYLRNSFWHQSSLASSFSENL